MGYIGFQTGNAGKSIQIQSMTDTTTKITVYVQNTGSGSVSFPTSTTSPFAYVNGTSWTATASPSTIAPGATSTIALTNTGPALYSGEQVTVKISTTSGTYSQVTQALP
jgi:archaellum component FlaG (FlaF/FlaG flagellin family)